MTTLRIYARRVWWWLSYRGLLLLLTVLAVVRYLALGLAFLAHRAHTAVAAHGETVADTIGVHSYRDTVRPRQERYARMAAFLLTPKD